MSAKPSLDDLHDRCEQLVTKQSLDYLSDAQRQHISKKFASKSLQELYELVQELKKSPHS